MNIFSMIAFIRKYLILTAFFVFLFFCLFVGDGQQMLIDVVGAGGVLVLTFIAFLYGKKERELPVFPLIVGSMTIIYFCIRTIFSDDIGHSVYSTVRMIDVFLVFYLLYCYSTDEDRNIFPKFILGFCMVSLFVSCLYFCVPSLSHVLPNSNLLIPTYGHNNIVDILLFGIPVAVFFAIKTRKFLYLFIFIFLFLGILFSFARVAMGIVVLFLVVILFFYRKRISIKTKIMIGVFCFFITGMMTILFFVPQTSYTRYFPDTIVPKMTKEVDKAGNRFEYFRQAGEAIKERPLFGSGPGTFILQSKRLQSSSDSFSRYAHNVFLQELTEEGIVGMTLILCLLVWWAITCFGMYKKKEQSQRWFFVLIGSGIVLQTMNACADFSLSFLVIQMLFVSSMALVALDDSSKTRRVSRFPAIVYVWIGVIFIFYILTSLTSIGFGKYISIFASYHFLSEFSSIEYLKKSDPSVSSQDVTFISTLHKKNPDVLSLLGGDSLSQAAQLFPKDFIIHQVYIQTLIQEKKYSETGIALQRLCVSVLRTYRQTMLPDTVCSSDFTSPVLQEAYEVVDPLILDDAIGIDVSLAKYFYLLGYHILSKDPSLTIQLWKLAASFAPQWSYFPVELANLYYQQKDYLKVLEILDECQEYIEAYGHCVNVSFSNLQTAGFFMEDILQIPKTGMLIKKQTHWDSYDQKKTITILNSLVRLRDVTGIRDILSAMTTRFFSEEQKKIVENMDFSDPLFIENIPLAISLLEKNSLHINDRVFLAKLYYFIGYFVLDINPDMTKKLWNFSFYLAPEWSYFPVELASLYHQEHEDVAGSNILRQCQNNVDASYHCQKTTLNTIPKPGFFYEDVLRLPDQSKLINMQLQQ